MLRYTLTMALILSLLLQTFAFAQTCTELFSDDFAISSPVTGSTEITVDTIFANKHSYAEDPPFDGTALGIFYVTPAQFSKWIPVSGQAHVVTGVGNSFRSLPVFRASTRSKTSAHMTAHYDSGSPYRSNLRNSESFFSPSFKSSLVTGIRMVARGEPGLILRVQFLHSLSRHEGELYYFDIKLNSSFEEFLVPFSSFKSIKVDKNHPIYGRHILKHTLSFEIVNPGIASNAWFEISGPLVFERNYNGNFRYYAEQIYEHLVKNYLQGGYTDDEVISVIEKTLRNEHDPEKQAYAVDLVNSHSEEELKQMLDAKGIRWRVINSKLDDREFFIEYGQILASIPIERGEFGEDHGPLSHIAQFFAKTAGMTYDEMHIIRTLLRHQNNWLPPRWHYWIATWDAPGNTSPNSPRFWRDLINKARQQRALAPN